MFYMNHKIKVYPIEIKDGNIENLCKLKLINSIKWPKDWMRNLFTTATNQRSMKQIQSSRLPISQHSRCCKEKAKANATSEPILLLVLVGGSIIGPVCLPWASSC